MPPSVDAPAPEAPDRARWFAAGLDRLTGPVDWPGLGPPPGFVERVDALTLRLGDSSRAVGEGVELDGLEQLAVRGTDGADGPGLRRRGPISCGGACHLVEGDDGWFAISLSRTDDWELLPAWLGIEPGGTDRWDEVHRRCRSRPVADLVDRGATLGLPIGALGEQPPTSPARFLPATTAPRRGARAGPLRVADLSSMWAGPLCGAILSAAGADVLKVESRQRPDGTRRGSPALHERLNGDKTSVVVDLTTPAGIDELRSLLRSVDVVVESARPRALQQLGIDASQLLDEAGGPDLWVSITGHGRDGRHAHRVAFGDDAAVSGGLVSWWRGRPNFCADAVADPLTGMWAATVALEALAEQRRGLLDVAMSRVAAHFADTSDGAVA